jgi:dTDP-glucose pyrophosphorylase
MNEDREAVVLLLAGGKGTRIKRLGTTEVLTVPKSLIRIRYKGKVAPMMFFAMDSILAKGYRNFVALVGADPETGGVQIEKALEQRYHSLISSGRMSDRYPLNFT